MNSPTLMRVFPVIPAVCLLLIAGPATVEAQALRNVRVCVQFIEMPHTALTELMSGKAQPGHVLHEKAMAMTKQGKAKLLESAMIIARSGQRATIETIQELIYPTEYEPPGYVPPTPPPDPRPTPRPSLCAPLAWETRNAGTTFEIEPTLDESGHLCDLRFIPEMVDTSSFNTIWNYKDEWGDASYVQPTFETWRVNTQMTFQVGKFDLAATITPKPTEPVPATLRKILVFIRCDVIPVIPRL
jgi:hypothetical protein